jgi:hypothetical protein
VNKTDKYILNILEHNNLQNTMFTLLWILIQERKYRKLIILCKSSLGGNNQLMLCTSSSYCYIIYWNFQQARVFRERALIIVVITCAQSERRLDDWCSTNVAICQ